MAYVIEMESYRLADGVVETLRYSSGRGFATLPTDSPPNVFIAPRLSQPLIARRVLFDRATTYGATAAGAGEFQLVNADGGLDMLVTDYAIAGRRLRAWIGIEGAPFPSGWTLTMTGTVQQVAASGSTLTVSLADRLADLDEPLLPSTFAGSNALPMGIEGVDDIKGTRKPRVLGRVRNISPVLVNTSKLVWQISDRSCAVTAAYDGGVALTAGPAYASVDEVQATAPAAGQYRVYTGADGCYLRTGSGIARSLTVDADSGTACAAVLAVQVLTAMGIEQIDAGDVAALAALNPAPVGLWATDDTTARDVLDRLMGSVGAWYGFDRFGVLRMGRLEAPAGQPVAILSDVTTLDLQSTADSDRGLPAWRVKLTYGLNYTAQSDGELAGDKAGEVDPVGGLARRAWLAEDHRTATAEDAARKSAWPTAPELEMDTCLCEQADAEAEAARRLALYGGRLLFQVRLPLTPGNAGIEPGCCVILRRPRWGMRNGRLLRVIGWQVNFELNELTLRLWG